MKQVGFAVGLVPVLPASVESAIFVGDASTSRVEMRRTSGSAGPRGSLVARDDSARSGSCSVGLVLNVMQRGPHDFL
jgi:hypothetical protein